MALHVGDRAPEWTLMAAHAGEVKELALVDLLTAHRAVVLTSYVLDFTGG